MRIAGGPSGSASGCRSSPVPQFLRSEIWLSFASYDAETGEGAQDRASLLNDGMIDDTDELFLEDDRINDDGFEAYMEMDDADGKPGDVGAPQQIRTWSLMTIAAANAKPSISAARTMRSDTATPSRSCIRDLAEKCRGAGRPPRRDCSDRPALTEGTCRCHTDFAKAIGKETV